MNQLFELGDGRRLHVCLVGRLWFQTDQGKSGTTLHACRATLCRCDGARAGPRVIFTVMARVRVRVTVRHMVAFISNQGRCKRDECTLNGACIVELTFLYM